MSSRANVRGALGPTVSRASRAGLCWVEWLLAVLLLGVTTGLACQGSAARDGVGGQSGDEGRRMRSQGLGTGGVAAELPPRR